MKEKTLYEVTFRAASETHSWFLLILSHAPMTVFSVAACHTLTDLPFI